VLRRVDIAWKNGSSVRALTMPASIQLASTPAPKQGPSGLARRHQAVNQDRRGRYAYGAVLPSDPLTRRRNASLHEALGRA
jgi:hypothetical protein